MTQLIITHQSSLLLQIVDIGIGTVNDNAAGVFSKLKNVTDNKEKINNFANLNVSVYVLFTLSQKPTLQPNDSVANVSITESLIIFTVICYNGFQLIWG